MTTCWSNTATAAGRRNRYAMTSSTRSFILLLLLTLVMLYWGMWSAVNDLFPYRQLRMLGLLHVQALDERPAIQPDGSAANEDNAQAHKEWAQKLAQGGFILHIRHAQREKWNDVTAFDAVALKQGADGASASYARAVCLTAQGKEEAKLIGDVFRLAGIQVSLVVSSPSCRAVQTAESAFGRVDDVRNSLLHRTAMMKEQHAEFAAALRDLMMTVPLEPGKNVVLSGHAGTLRIDGSRVVDEDQTDGVDLRDETGVLVLERVDGRLIARHRFKSIHELATASIRLPVS